MDWTAAQVLSAAPAAPEAPEPDNQCGIAVTHEAIEISGFIGGIGEFFRAFSAISAIVFIR
jgi:hypothetical protein